MSNGKAHIIIKIYKLCPYGKVISKEENQIQTYRKTSNMARTKI